MSLRNLMMVAASVLVSLVFALPSCAQTEPAPILAVVGIIHAPVESPKPNGKVFWLGAAALAAAKTYDAAETQALLDRGGYERNPLYGAHPSPARLGLFMGAMFFGEALLFRMTERSKHKPVRWLGRGYITFTVAEHLRSGACDAGISMQGPIQNCHALF